MKISKIDCDRFAGITQFHKDLNPGLNVFVGDNETGKSTIAEFLFRMMFQPTKTDARKDAGFIDTCFPATVDGKKDSIWGSIQFSTDDGEYNLKKTWNIGKKEKSGSLVILPSGDPEDDEANIAEILKEYLKYCEGTYRETVFSSQRFVKKLVQSLFAMSDSQEKKDVFSVLADAASRTSGISVDQLKAAIEAKYDQYCFGWDFDADCPGQYKKNYSVGLILLHYMDITKLREEMENLVIKLDGVESINQDLKKMRDDLQTKIQLQKDYQKCQDTIRDIESKQDRLKRVSKDLSDGRKVAREWPEKERTFLAAKDLPDQLKNADIFERYNRIKKLYDDYEEKNLQLEACTKVDPAHLSMLKKLEKERENLEKKLSGVGVIAKILKKENCDVQFHYVGSDEAVPQNGNEIKIDRAMRIEIPEHLEMEIECENVDAGKIELQIKKIEEDSSKIYAIYDVRTKIMLESLQEEYNEKKNECDSARSRFESALAAGESWEALTEKFRSLPENVKSRDEVKVHLEELNISENDLIRTLEASKLFVEANEDKYQSVDALKKKIEKWAKEEDELTDCIDKLEASIPEEIRSLDPDTLTREISKLEEEIESKDRDLRSASSGIINEKPLAEYEEEIAEKEEELNKLIRTGKRWAEIKKTFDVFYDTFGKSDISSLTGNFAKYLLALTDDAKVNSINESTHTLDLNSGENKLTYETLSNGHQDSVEFAFRLAMLDEIFPEGGGFAIFDDPFADMDPSRVKKACQLLKEFSKKNQVIFFTCDPKYVKDADLMKDANHIDMPEKKAAGTASA